MNEWMRLPMIGGDVYLVPVGEGDTLRAVAAAAVAWKAGPVGKDRTALSPISEALFDAVVAHEAATAPAPPRCSVCNGPAASHRDYADGTVRCIGCDDAMRAAEERPAPKCADCGKPLPAAGSGVIEIQHADGAVERVCSACLAKRAAAARQHARAERVRAAIKAHEGQLCECQLTQPGPWVVATCVTARSNAFAATVKAVRWWWKCTCPDCSGDHCAEQRFEEADDA